MPNVCSVSQLQFGDACHRLLANRIEEAIVALVSDSANSSRVDLLVFLDRLQQAANPFDAAIRVLGVGDAPVSNNIIHHLRSGMVSLSVSGSSRIYAAS